MYQLKEKQNNIPFIEIFPIWKAAGWFSLKKILNESENFHNCHPRLSLTPMQPNCHLASLFRSRVSILENSLFSSRTSIDSFELEHSRISTLHSKHLLISSSHSKFWVILFENHLFAILSCCRMTFSFSFYCKKCSKILVCTAADSHSKRCLNQIVWVRRYPLVLR